MKLSSLSMSALLAVTMSASAADQSTGIPETTKLWDGNPPGYTGTATAEMLTPTGGIANVTIPGIAVHLPEKGHGNGAAIIVCPGGSYREVGRFASGMMALPFFVSRGFAVIVLKYRTRPPNEHVEPLALEDAKRAIRYVRHHAREWDIDPEKIGLVGGSAGSHLVLNESTHSDAGTPAAADPVDRESSRPAFMCLLCPWPDKQSVESFPIGKDTPPAFIASALDDQVAPTSFAQGLAQALQKSDVPVELWILQHGGHTAFMQTMGEGSHWQERVLSWLTKINIIK